MKEYTVVEITMSNYKMAELLALKPYLFFHSEGASIPKIINGGLLREENGLLIYETEGFYEGIPRSQANQGTKIELYKEWQHKNKIGDGLIIAKYFDKANRNDWKIETELNESNSQIQPVYMEFSQEDKELLEYGGIPRQMEDKWFSYLEGDVIHFLRSWTGIEIFKARLEKIANNQWAIRTLYTNNSTDFQAFSKPNLFKDLVEIRIRIMRSIMQ